jgi:hypothetical protein
MSRAVPLVATTLVRLVSVDRQGLVPRRLRPAGGLATLPTSACRSCRLWLLCRLLLVSVWRWIDAGSVALPTISAKRPWPGG